MANITHYDSLAVIIDDFDIWGGKTSLSASDFRLGDGGELPPSTIAHLGNKKIISSDHLRGFNRLKTACRRFLLRHGVPFMNGVAVPVKVVPDIAQKLDAIGVEFQTLRSDFLANYDMAVSDWVSAHPDYEAVIRRNALTELEVAKRLNFEYQVFMISASQDPALSQKLSEKVDGLGDGLVQEVADTALKMYDVHFAGKARCGARAQQQLKGLRDKVDGLSFLNGNLAPLVGMMDSALRLFQTTSQGGFVQAPYFWEVASVVLILSQRRTIEQYAKNEIVIDDIALSIQNQMAGSSVVLPANMQATQTEQPAVLTQTTQQSIPATLNASTDQSASPSAPLTDIEAFFAMYREKPANLAPASQGAQELPSSQPQPPIVVVEPQTLEIEPDPRDQQVSNFAESETTVVPTVVFDNEMAFF